MTWLTDMPGMGAAQDRASKAMRFPVGMTSPLWLAFGAAASAGVAWWWMSKLARPVNLEAMLGKPAAAALAPVTEAAEAVAEASEAMAEAVIEPVVILAETVAVEPIAEAPASVEAAVDETAPEPGAEPQIAPEPVVEAGPDDLTRLVGIGPKLAASLAARGVTRFVQLAAWTAEDLAAADAALSLKGRAVRDAWVAQAKRLAAA